MALTFTWNFLTCSVKGVVDRAGHAYPSRAHDVTSGFLRIFILEVLQFLCRLIHLHCALLFLCTPLFCRFRVCYLDFVLSGFCRLLKKSFYLVHSVFCCRYCLLAYHVTASNYYIPIDTYTYVFAHIFNFTWKELEIQSSVAQNAQ